MSWYSQKSHSHFFLFFFCQNLTNISRILKLTKTWLSCLLKLLNHHSHVFKNYSKMTFTLSKITLKLLKTTFKLLKTTFRFTKNPFRLSKNHFVSLFRGIVIFFYYMYIYIFFTLKYKFWLIFQIEKKLWNWIHFNIQNINILKSMMHWFLFFL